MRSVNGKQRGSSERRYHSKTLSIVILIQKRKSTIESYHHQKFTHVLERRRQYRHDKKLALEKRIKDRKSVAVIIYKSKKQIRASIVA